MIGATEMGTGAATTATAQICAEELGVELGDVDVICSDSETIPADFGTYGSRVTTLSGNAVRDACAQVREQLYRVGRRGRSRLAARSSRWAGARCS